MRACIALGQGPEQQPVLAVAQVCMLPTPCPDSLLHILLPTQFNTLKTKAGEDGFQTALTLAAEKAEGKPKDGAGATQVRQDRQAELGAMDSIRQQAGRKQALGRQPSGVLQALTCC